MHNSFAKKITRLIGPWFVLCFYMANLSRMTGHSETPYIALILVVGIIGLYQMISNKCINRGFLIRIFALYAFTGLMESFCVGNESIGDVLRDLLLYGIAVMMLSFPIRYYEGVIFFYITVYILGVALLSGSFIREILVSSENYISVLLILSATLYYIGLHHSDRKFMIVDIIPPIICLMLSILANGRGGIISSAALLVLILLAYLRQLRNENRKLYKISCGLLIISVVYILWNGFNMFDEFLTLGKLESQGIEDASRPRIWSSYFSKMFDSPIYILNGAPLDNIPAIHQFGNNTHNSFIQLHAFNGLFMFAAFWALLFLSLVRYYKNKEAVMIIVILIMVLRGMTDKYIFGQYGMPIMLYLVFLPFASPNSKKM